MECPNCQTELEAQLRKEKYKFKGVKLAVNLNVFICNTCQEEFIDEEEQRIYQEKCRNFVQKVENSIKKVSVH